MAEFPDPEEDLPPETELQDLILGLAQQYTNIAAITDAIGDIAKLHDGANSGPLPNIDILGESYFMAIQKICISLSKARSKLAKLSLRLVGKDGRIE